MKTHDLYGFLFSDLDEVAARLAGVLEITWVPHESLYWGEYCLADAIGEESFQLVYNYHELEQEWVVPSFSEYPILLYVDSTERPDEIKTLIFKSDIEGTALLRRKVYDS